MFYLLLFSLEISHVPRIRQNVYLLEESLCLYGTFKVKFSNLVLYNVQGLMSSVIRQMQMPIGLFVERFISFVMDVVWLARHPSAEFALYQGTTYGIKYQVCHAPKGTKCLAPCPEQ